MGFNDAQQLLTNLGKAALGQSYETTGTSVLPQLATPPSSSTQTEETTPAVDPVTQAMRRASLLIGGFKIDESLFPSAPASLPVLNAEDVDLLATLASLGLPISGVDAEALLTLVGKLKAELAAGGLATLNGEGLQLLESVKAGLAEVGLIGLTEENSQFLSDLTAQLRGLNIGLADTFELEELLGRLRSGPEIARTVPPEPDSRRMCGSSPWRMRGVSLQFLTACKTVNSGFHPMICAGSRRFSGFFRMNCRRNPARLREAESLAVGFSPVPTSSCLKS